MNRLLRFLGLATLRSLTEAQAQNGYLRREISELRAQVTHEQGWASLQGGRVRDHQRLLASMFRTVAQFLELLPPDTPGKNTMRATWSGLRWSEVVLDGALVLAEKEGKR